SGTERERLLAKHVFPGLQCGKRERMVGARRRNDGHRIEIVAANEFHWIGVRVRNLRFSGRFLRLVATAAADGCDLPPFGAEGGYMDLPAEANANDADLACGRRHEWLPMDQAALYTAARSIATSAIRLSTSR